MQGSERVCFCSLKCRISYIWLVFKFIHCWQIFHFGTQKYVFSINNLARTERERFNATKHIKFHKTIDELKIIIQFITNYMRTKIHFLNSFDVIIWRSNEHLVLCMLVSDARFINHFPLAKSIYAMFCMLYRFLTDERRIVKNKDIKRNGRRFVPHKNSKIQ